MITLWHKINTLGTLMLNKRLKIIFVATLSVMAASSTAQMLKDDAELKVPAERQFLEALRDSSDKTKGVVILNMDPRLEKLMEQKHKMASDRSSAAGMGVGNRSVQGYRVQVFSSNQRTAKTDAQNVVQQIRSKAPKLPVYVSYQSPFWKVRVGNCETTTEAQQLRNDMKGLFPELASEIYIVKGKVNVE